MGTEIEIHPIQAGILCTLLFKPQAKFSELNSEGLTSDHFSFHINYLVSHALVEKTADKKYSLTAKGKEFANRLDTEKVEIERQPKIGVLVVPVRVNGKKTEYLVQKRLKQPYYGFSGFLTGKIRWGDRADETAARELLEETGLAGKIKLVAVKHKMDYSPDGQLLEDKFFMVFRADDTGGELKTKFEGGENSWKTRDEIMKLDDLFDGVVETVGMAGKDQLSFVETKYTVSKY